MERWPWPTQKKPRSLSQMQSPAPSCRTPSGSSITSLDQAKCPELEEGFAEHGLFALALGVTEAGDQNAAVQHNRGVGGKHQVGQVFGGGHRFYPGADLFQRQTQRLRASGCCRLERQRIGPPSVRPHPGIDLIGHAKVADIGHQ